MINRLVWYLMLWRNFVHWIEIYIGCIAIVLQPEDTSAKVHDLELSILFLRQTTKTTHPIEYHMLCLRALGCCSSVCCVVLPVIMVPSQCSASLHMGGGWWCRNDVTKQLFSPFILQAHCWPHNSRNYPKTKAKEMCCRDSFSGEEMFAGLLPF